MLNLTHWGSMEVNKKKKKWRIVWKHQWGVGKSPSHLVAQTVWEKKKKESPFERSVGKTVYSREKQVSEQEGMGTFKEFEYIKTVSGYVS